MIENHNCELHNLPNKGIMFTQAPALVMDEIRQSIDSMVSKQLVPVEYNSNLAGHIQKEFRLDFSPAARSMIEQIGQHYHEWHRSPSDVKNNFIEAWVNMQFKHEFNPIHNHDGVLSWVIWVQIPYKLEDEYKMFPKANCNKASIFGFVYTDTLGNIATHELEIDETWQGRMCIFPAAMRHFVYPFYTSDGVRISVAGNLG